MRVEPAGRAQPRAERRQRRQDRAEARRFTRRTRNRRAALGWTAGIICTLLALLMVAVYSPLFALRVIEIDGASRVDAEQVEEALSGQLGTPLALIDYGRITGELGDFPLIRSYVTEIVPPDTLRIQLVEREPVGALPRGDGFVLVDPAGVALERSETRVAGLPIIDLAGENTSSAAFRSVVEVLIAMPAPLRSRVDSISARTKDDVSLVLVGVGQRVRWGSADHSDQKAALLAALIKVTNPSRPGEFDVSAPTNGIFRPQ